MCVHTAGELCVFAVILLWHNMCILSKYFSCLLPILISLQAVYHNIGFRYNMEPLLCIDEMRPGMLKVFSINDIYPNLLSKTYKIYSGTFT